jgi:hypothetical protein
MLLTNLSFEDWIEHAFTRDVHVQQVAWYFDPNHDLWDPKPLEAVAYLTRLFEDPERTLCWFTPHRTERRILATGQQYLRPRYPARRLGSRSRKSCQSFNLFAGQCQFDYSPPSCHDAAPRSANRKTRNPPSTHRFHDAAFMESIV